jgi:hypothetical protein
MNLEINEIELAKLLYVNTEIANTYFDGTFTKASMFLLPLLGIDKERSNVKNHLVNAFVDDHEFEHLYEKAIFVLLKVKDFDNKNFRALDEYFLGMDSFRYHYNVGMEEGYDLIMYVFETPAKYHREYELFKTGQYSKYSDDAKKEFGNTTRDKNNNPIEPTAYGVVYRTETMRNKLMKTLELSDTMVDSLPEFYDKPTEERECFRFNPNKNETEQG